MTNKRQILSDKQIDRIIKRLARQIYEHNFEEKNLLIAGVEGQGEVLANLLFNELSGIQKDIELAFLEVKVDKENPENVIIDKSEYVGDKTPVLLVDDVMHTGKTLANCLRTFMELSVPRLDVVVLVDRGHRNYPITPTFSGYSLATTLEEHVEVVLGENQAVYLY